LPVQLGDKEVQEEKDDTWTTPSQDFSGSWILGAHKLKVISGDVYHLTIDITKMSITLSIQKSAALLSR
jgi:hypothetical protein